MTEDFQPSAGFYSRLWAEPEEPFKSFPSGSNMSKPSQSCLHRHPCACFQGVWGAMWRHTQSLRLAQSCCHHRPCLPASRNLGATLPTLRAIKLNAPEPHTHSALAERPHARSWTNHPPLLKSESAVNTSGELRGKTCAVHAVRVGGGK